MLTKKLCLSISYFLCVLGSSLFATDSSSTVKQMYEERYKLLELMFPEEKIEMPSLQGLELLQKDKMPKHVCINMEGHRHWARKKNLPFSEAYKISIKNTLQILKLEVLLGIKTVTIPCFSLNNMRNRPLQEVEDLLDLLNQYLNEKGELAKKFIRIKTIGDLSLLPLHLQESLEKIKKETASCTNFTVILSINYFGRDEIRRGVKKIAEDIEAGTLHSKDISIPLIGSYLDSADIPDVDLFIQTSNDHHMWGAWPLFYTECFFVPMPGPEFKEQDFINVLIENQEADRKFGS